MQEPIEKNKQHVEREREKINNMSRERKREREIAKNKQHVERGRERLRKINNMSVERESRNRTVYSTNRRKYEK